MTTATGVPSTETREHGLKTFQRHTSRFWQCCPLSPSSESDELEDTIFVSLTSFILDTDMEVVSTGVSDSEEVDKGPYCKIPKYPFKVGLHCGDAGRLSIIACM